jgi:hypothetical protein
MTIHSTTKPPESTPNTAPQYPMDDGPLSAAQLRQIRKLAPQGKKRALRSSLLDLKRKK